MLDNMSAAEHIAWIAFFGIEPFPEQRADMRAAEQIRVALWAGGSKHVPASRDLLPDWWDERNAPQSPEHIRANLRAAFPKKKKNAS